MKWVWMKNMKNRREKTLQFWIQTSCISSVAVHPLSVALTLWWKRTGITTSFAIFSFSNILFTALQIAKCTYVTVETEALFCIKVVKQEGFLPRLTPNKSVVTVDFGQGRERRKILWQTQKILTKECTYSCASGKKKVTMYNSTICWLLTQHLYASF